MKIETNLVYKNIRNNIKRAIFTTISMILCTFLIVTTLFVIASIRKGITESVDKDYHFGIKDLSPDSFNKIKDKEYIDKIYIQQNGNGQLKEIEKPYNLFNTDNINVYIKYDNIKETCKYSNDIIKGLRFSYRDVIDKCEFNEKMLTVYGLIDIQTVQVDGATVCEVRVNYSYVIDAMIVVILLFFSIISIIILYNAFLITINERKKEYAILNSVGATEGQILKMIFLEAIMTGIIGIVLGGAISVLGTNIILRMLNNILEPIGYNFTLAIEMKDVILSLCIILCNIFISSLIPSVKASTTSVIQGIRNNKQIKYKKRVSILEKILPVEGKLALKNIKRNKNKYRVITILLVISIVSFIVVSTYINYEKEASDLVTEYDVDAELIVNTNSSQHIDYKAILEAYEKETGDKIEYMEYKRMGPFVLVEPEEAIATSNIVTTYENNQKGIDILLIGLDDKTYNNYINKVNASEGDIIIYNNTIIHGITEENYTYYPAFKQKQDLKLSLIAQSHNYEKDIHKYEIIDDENLKGNFVLTDTVIEGYKEVKAQYTMPAVFVNRNTYDKIAEKFDNYVPKNENYISRWMWGNKSEDMFIKIKCNNIISFSKYIDNINKKQDLGISTRYYTLKNQEKIIYIAIVQLILKVVMVAIVTIGIISTINIINASLSEREQEFKILDSLGATKENVNKILIYECVYMFIKATIIAIIIAVPILYQIIKYMEKVIAFHKILIPFNSIGLFLVVLFIISLGITIYSTGLVRKGKE